MVQPAVPSAALEANRVGMAALQSGDAAAARTAFEQATAADPQAGPLWMNLAHANRLLGDAGGERLALDRALSLDRTDFGAQLRLAQLLQRTGAERDAMIAWSGAAQLAAALPGLPSAVLAEVAAGQAYADGLRARLAAASSAVVETAQGAGETAARRVGAFVDHALGRRALYTNSCAGVHYPFLPADEFFDRRHFPWFAELEAAAAEIAAELAALLADPGEALRPYVRLDEGTPVNDWSALDGSLDWGACFLWEYGEPNAAVISRCPRTAALLERMPLQRIAGRAPNAFFSMLKPGKTIPPHTGVTNTRAIVHLALDVPPDCGFRVGGETREWIEGKAFAFDDTIEHEAWNRSDRRRAVLILDTWNPHLEAAEREAIAAYFAASDRALA
ncbi:aspartyl/asparaginyl beta-hydroxylase domain-containing protein [Parablastomonas sp. CN1-191]|uniref:aspartyl/asparaginyl beta-hydroxylase domain-containing protein n=1 Tax=Parablastomonas sp. CN1-191 TaxID=3400908 RepID=UPI003BF80F5E